MNGSVSLFVIYANLLVVDNITDDAERKNDNTFDLEREAFKIYDENLNREVVYASFSDNISDQLRGKIAIIKSS